MQYEWYNLKIDHSNNHNCEKKLLLVVRSSHHHQDETRREETRNAESIFHRFLLFDIHELYQAAIVRQTAIIVLTKLNSCSSLKMVLVRSRLPIEKKD